VSGEAQRRGIDDARRLHDISATGGLTPFEIQLLEGLRLITQRLGEIASALEDRP
jgi:hypothetical protein